MSRPYVLINVSGPYGAGKDTLLRRILESRQADVRRVSTITTRPTSPDADPSYTNVSHKDLAAITASGRWIVTNQIGGDVRYGTSLDEIESIATRGRIAVHSIYPSDEGAGNLRRVFNDRLFSIGVLASLGDLDVQLKVLRDRLIARGRDDTSTIEARLNYQREAIEYILENPFVDTPFGPMRVFDEIIVNEDLAASEQAMRAIWVDQIEPTLGEERIRTDFEIVSSATGRIDGGGGYYNPTADLSTVGRKITIDVGLYDLADMNVSENHQPTFVINKMFRALTKLVPDDQLLFGIYSHDSYRIAPYLYDEERLAEFEHQVATGSLSRCAYISIPRDVANEGLRRDFG